MLKKTKSARTALPRLNGYQPTQVTQLTDDDLRRAGGGLLTVTSGQCTLNCDDWGDCD